MLSDVKAIPLTLTRSQSSGASNGTNKASENVKSAQSGVTGLSNEELKQLEQLKARDRKVKAHEQAHLSAAGGIVTGGANFTFATGPNGVRYAIGGEVNIDTSAVPGDPEATLRKAEMIRRAALSPAEPSFQDQKVARSAIAMANKARIELIQQRQQEALGNNEESQQSIIDISV